MSVTVPPFDVLRQHSAVFREFLPRAELVHTLMGSPTVTSWYRDRWNNRRVGGSERSQHLLGMAYDVVPDDPDQYAQLARVLGMTAIVERDHVHVQFFPAGFIPGRFFV